MSYILDALTKSQRERRQGGVPTLSTPQLMADASRNAPGRYAGGAVLLLATAGLLLGAYTLVRQSGDLDDSLDSTAGVTPAASLSGTPPAAAGTDPSFAPAVRPAPSPRPPAGSTPISSPSPDTGPLPLVTFGRIQEIPASSPPPATTGTTTASGTRPAASTTSPAPFTGSIPESEERAAIRAAEQRLFPAPVAPSHPETVRLLDDLRSMAEGPVAQPPSTTAGAAVPRATAAAQAPATREPEPIRTSPIAGAPTSHGLGRIRDLPSQLRSRLGALAINVHVYADEPDERMVIINMKRYREGEQLREGPRLDSITSTGAVLSYQSHRFLLDAR